MKRSTAVSGSVLNRVASWSANRPGHRTGRNDVRVDPERAELDRQRLRHVSSAASHAA